MMEYFWRLYIHGFEEWLVRVSSLIIFAFDPVVSLLLIIIYFLLSLLKSWNDAVTAGVWEREKEEEEEREGDRGRRKEVD